MNTQTKIVRKIFAATLLVLSVFVLYACKSKVVKIKVTFVNTNLEVEEIDKGQKINRPANPTKEGYTFENWYADEEFKELFSFETTLEEDTNIYALFYISIAQLIKEGSRLDHGTISDHEYYVKASIKSIANTEWGNMTIEDETGNVFVYGLNSPDGGKFNTIEDKPIVGDEIQLRGPIKNFNDVVELNTATLIKVIANEGGSDLDLTDYEEVSILDARVKDANSKVLVTGIVANITYANSNKPNGVYLVDHSDSIYIYSNDIASSVQVGDKIQVAGSRANFILDTELGLANQLGYKGAIQLDQAHLINKISGNNKLDLSWTKEKTIKEIMDTDYKVDNLTSTTFKTKAFINKVDGKGFINYYFNDLDGTTGSYTYSMNNGSDFSWLDQYDGQLRTVYISVINAKATPAGMIYRLMPIVIGDVFEYNQEYNAEFAVKYHTLDQFEANYFEGASPDKELVTTVTNEKLDIKGVNVSYTSNNEEVIYFETVNGKTILKTKDAGVAEITIEAKDAKSQYSQKITVEVVEVPEYNDISVDQATKSNDNTEVTVRGVVASSLVNKTGFYLIDETGMIAIQLTSDALKGVELGNEVVVKGIKTHVGGKESVVGQIAIDQAEIIVNYKGSHEYATNNFISGKTLADVNKFDNKEDHSTEVYVFEATIFFEETPFFSRYQLRDGDAQMNIYSANGSQLSFLAPYQNKRVTVEFTVVNWNGKSYSGSIISVSDGITKTVCDTNFR